MTVSQDLLAANFSTFQSELQPLPNTTAATTTIAPTTLITFLTGTAVVGTVTPPLPGQHMLILIFTDNSPGTMATTGNIANGANPIVPTQNCPTFLFYDPVTAKYWCCASNIT